MVGIWPYVNDDLNGECVVQLIKPSRTTNPDQTVQF